MAATTVAKTAAVVVKNTTVDPSTTSIDGAIIALSAVIVGIAGGILVKIVYDWIRPDSKYILRRECDVNRKQCASMSSLKTEFLQYKAEVDTRLKQHDQILQDIHTTVMKTNDFIHKLDKSVSILVATAEKMNGGG